MELGQELRRVAMRSISGFFLGGAVDREIRSIGRLVGRWIGDPVRNRVQKGTAQRLEWTVGSHAPISS